MLTDSEFTKALECCAKKQCVSCPLNLTGNPFCEEDLKTESANRINHLQEKNERLNDLLKRHQRHTNRIRLITAETAKKIKSEAYKECIEKVKEKATDVGICDAQGNNYGGATVVFVNDINNLSKELVGENTPKANDVK